MKTKEGQKRAYKTFEREATVCRTEWQRVLPWCQQCIDEGAKVGLTIDNELLADLVHWKGRATIPLLKERAESDAKKTGISDPAVLQTLIGNPAQRAEGMLKAADMVLHCLNTSFLAQPLRGSQSLDFLTIIDSKAVLTPESWQTIVDTYFTAYITNPTQEKLFELAQQATPAINSIYEILVKFDANITLKTIFQYDPESEKFELNPFVLRLVE